jgi:hypothetical protein
MRWLLLGVLVCLIAIALPFVVIILSMVYAGGYPE